MEDAMPRFKKAPSPEKKAVVYVGPQAGVTILDCDVRAPRGVAVAVPAELADRLLEQAVWAEPGSEAPGPERTGPDEAPSEEAPSEEAPSEEAPSEEAPSEEAPEDPADGAEKPRQRRRGD